MTELNRDKFRKWLEGHRPRQVVAMYPTDTALWARPPEKVMWSCNCPIANYLKASGSQDVSVGAYNIRLGDDRSDTPEWATAFIREIDDHVDEHPNITASRALKILDRIEQ